MSLESRLTRVEGSLSPRQATIALIAEAHAHGSLEQWMAQHIGCSDAQHPLGRLIHQVEEATRASIKSIRPQDRVQPVAMAREEAVFLYQVFVGLQARASEVLIRNRLLLRALFSELREIVAQRAAAHFALESWGYLSDRTPYPTTAPLASAWRAALDGRVEAWDGAGLEEAIQEWVVAHYMAEGRPTIPQGAYLALRGETNRFYPEVEPAELRPHFASEADYERFLAGEDFTWGLVVPDAELEAACERVRRGLRALVREGAVEAGRSVRLESVPIPLLREVPLLDGEWVDATLLELAETGALLQREGVRLEDPDDNHIVAWAALRDEAGAVLPVDRLREPLETARAHVARCPGERRELDGRTHLRLADYRRWRGRWVKGPLPAEEGLVAASWNRWVHAQGEEPRLDDIRVDTLFMWDGFPLQLCADEAEALAIAERRRDALAECRRWTLWDPEAADGYGSRPSPATGKSLKQAAAAWQDSARQALADLEGLQRAEQLIAERYFNAQAVLFPDVAESLTESVDDLTHLREFLESTLEAVPLLHAGGTTVDASPDIGEAARHHARQVVVHARAEALALLGEAQEARRLIEGLVWPDRAAEAQ